MAKTSLQEAISEAARLPHSMQDELGRDLMERIEYQRMLRDKIDQSVQSRDAGWTPGIADNGN